MMAKAMQLVFLLFMLVKITVSDAVFKLVNSSVQLDLQKDFELSRLSWKFNTSTNIVFKYKNELEVYGSYKDRVEFNKETYSLTLKNLQKKDSGVYTAELSGVTTETAATYKLYVLDSVEKPVLYDSLQKNNETCNVTLTCEAPNLSVVSHCYSNNCDKKEAKKEFLSLSLYLSESFIVCNHSNPVSWKNTTMELKHLDKRCPKDTTISNSTENTISVKLIIIIIGIIIIIIIIIIGFVWCIKNWCIKCIKKRTGDGNTCYEVVADFNKRRQETQSIEMPNSHESPTTVYSTVGMSSQTCTNDENPVSTADLDNKEMDTSKVNPSDCKRYDTKIFTCV